MKLDGFSNVVSLGGGTGLSCLLKGLKHKVLVPPVLEPPSGKLWISRLTAVVTVTDDGGSSGRLREEFQVLPPGDIRNCLVALSADESLLSQLFQYRFMGSGQLRDHSFGNLFLTALTGVTGDFVEAIRVSSDVLATKGRIYPSTLQDVRLEAVAEDGSRAIGETAISRSSARIRHLRLVPESCPPVPAVVQEIRRADIITVGPGSLFTSLLPNLLVPDIVREVRKSHAMKIFISNLMTQPGETPGFTASDHITAIYDHVGGDLFDAIILSSTSIPQPILARYRRQNSTPVANDCRKLRRLGLRVFEGKLIAGTAVVRHDPIRLADAVHRAYKSWQSSRASAN